MNGDNIMQATLTFNLDDPEGERRLRECLDAPDVMAAVKEYEEWLNRMIDSDDEPTTRFAFNLARGTLFDNFNARGLSPWSD